MIENQKAIHNILAEAISDVGSWIWWDADFPSLFQLEFVGVQLWSPPEKEGQPPSGKIALQFKNPSYVSFLTFKDCPFGSDWPELMKVDNLARNYRGVGVIINDKEKIDEAFKLEHAKGSFSLKKVWDPSNIDGDQEKIQSANFHCLVVGTGGIGVLVSSEGLEWRNHSERLTLDDVAERSQKWWSYWKEYWKAKDTDHPFPKDYACEATIPAAGSLDK